MNEETGALILNELTQIRRDYQVILEKVIRIEGSVDDVDDHETRIRALEASIPDEVKMRINALERWKWTAMGAIAASGGSLALSVASALKGL